MDPTAAPSRADALSKPALHRVGCVSFLNAKPLIDGLDANEGSPGSIVRFDVPSRLLDDLEAGEVDIALCPVIDYQRSRVPLVIVPVGGIGCDGTTLTVRLYSQVPLEEISAVHADTDSHTSVMLMRLLLAERHGVTPAMIDYHARESRRAGTAGRPVQWPQAMLLIGDKVVTDSPPAVRYPHQLDLGHAWRELTGLPFVFAVWMAREGSDLGNLPALLDATRRRNAGRIDAIVARHAATHGWPDDLARQYLGRWLKYAIGPRELEAMQWFAGMLAERGMIEQLRTLRIAP